MTLVDGSAEVVFSSSRSAAKRAPKVIVSSLKGESGRLLGFCYCGNTFIVFSNTFSCSEVEYANLTIGKGLSCEFISISGEC